MSYDTLRNGFLVPQSLIESGAAQELRERIAELEYNTGNDDGSQWLSLDAMGETLEFSRSFVLDIIKLARIMFLKNPLIRRGVNVKADYVFGQTVNISAIDDAVNEVVQAFLDDERNQIEFTAHAIRIQREKELQIDGNIFYVLMPHPITGRVRIHTLPALEITDVIADPNDRHNIWYYKREWRENVLNLDTGETTATQRVAYYRDWRYETRDRETINGAPIVAGAAIYHIKTGGFADWKYGIPEFYPALDWARAYKQFLENWSTIVAAYARFAFKVTTTGGKTGAVNARRKLETRLGTPGVETNPAPVTGAVFVAPEGNNIEPVKTAGATTKAEDGRRLLLMVAAAVGLPETFFGDVSVGTLATATSLDRPTELMFLNRQQLWKDIFHDIIQYVIACAVRAPDGALRAFGREIENEYGEKQIEFDDGTPKLIISFPSVIETDTVQRIAAIKQGVTLDGASPSVVPDLRIVARLVLSALGESDIDETIAALFPTDESAIPTTPAPAAPGVNTPEIDDELAQARETLREAINQLALSLKGTDNA